jgi:hypothetical protein
MNTKATEAQIAEFHLLTGGNLPADCTELNADIFIGRAKRGQAKYDGKWVVRSMTTTDWVPAYGPGRPEQKPEPYHIYLLPYLERRGAYWADIGRAELFDSPQAAETEAKRCLSPESAARVDIVPALDRGIPTYWELDKAAWERRVRSFEAADREAAKRFVEKQYSNAKFWR